MLRSRPWTSLTAALVTASACLAVIAAGDRPSQADPGRPHALSAWTDAPTLAIVTTEVRSGSSALRLVNLHQLATTGRPATDSPLARFQVVGRASVRARTVSASPWIAVNVPSAVGRDDSFNGRLLLVDAHSGAQRWLCDGLVHASRPLATDDGRLFITRGVAGALPPTPDQGRTDEFSIDELRLPHGQLHNLTRFQGYYLHLAGAWQQELIGYQVDAAGAQLVAVQRDNGTTRMLRAKLPPFARDFSVDTNRSVLVYRGRDDNDPRRWTVEQLDLTSLAQQRLYSGKNFALVPAAWPNGDVAYNPSRGGLRLLHRSEVWRSPWGQGVDVVRALSADGRYVAVLHTVAGRLPQATVLDRHTGAQLRIAVPARQRVAIAGFVDAAQSAGGAELTTSEVAP